MCTKFILMIALIHGTCLKGSTQLPPTKLRCQDSKMKPAIMRAHIVLNQFTTQTSFTVFFGSPFQIDDFESTFCLVYTIELYMNDNIRRHGLFNGKSTALKIRRQSFQSQTQHNLTVYTDKLVYLFGPLFFCKMNFLQTVKIFESI